MNRFTQLTLMILLFVITPNVFPQEMLYKPYRGGDIPFYDGDAVRSFLKRQTAYDTLWLPVSMIEIGGRSDTLSRHIYEYHENGLLKKHSIYDYNTGDLEYYKAVV